MTTRLLAIAALAGCALTSRAPARELRYFAPPDGHVSAEPSRDPDRPHVLRLRLGRVIASNHLRYAIEHRASAVEIAPYETLRWTELPDAYARRSLARALFDSRALEPALAGQGATLDVEVRAFEEISRPGWWGGRVELDYELRDERRVLGRGVVMIERAAAGASIEQVVTAIGAAMDAAAAELADRIVAALGSS